MALLARVAAEPRFKSLIFTPRGGGTGTNGQALNSGIIVDMSRYMNRIIEINPEEGWVRVEAGVIKDQLNQFLKPYGYFFAPELSTSNRATLGMINTDASGRIAGVRQNVGSRARPAGGADGRGSSIPRRCRWRWRRRWAIPLDGWPDLQHGLPALQGAA
ncbi:FAD-binding oxidoreductase [Klebsiella pneumoniae subsp. pneumoniae]|nr:FAD-binding oxidoreductase [Klebsiella pneumoniae subsp. pneumoniae]